MPQELLARRHTELLNKRDGEFRQVGRGKHARVEFVERGVDTTAVSRGLEMAYKLRGSFVAEPPIAPPALNVYNLFYKPEVRAMVNAFEDKLKEAIIHETTTVHSGTNADTEAGDTTGNDAGSVASDSR
jgi:hypothetical protein